MQNKQTGNEQPAEVPATVVDEPVSGVDSPSCLSVTLRAPYPVLCTCTPQHWHLSLQVPKYSAGRSPPQRSAARCS